MKSWYFNISDIKIKLSASDNEKIELSIPRFQLVDIKKEPDSDVQIYLNTIEDITDPNGTKCSSPHEHFVWINDTKVSRLSWDRFRKNPHMRIDYDLLNPNIIDCYIRQEYLAWAIREKYLWSGVGLQYILLHHEYVIFHASYIKVQERGIIFVAPSGTGKSTQAALWRKYRGAEIINGDKACIKVSEYPTVHGIPFEGTSGICKDVTCPLEGIVLLEQAKENSIMKLPAVLAIHSLFSNVFVDRSVPQEWNMALELIIKLIEKVPVYLLKCTPNERAVETLEQALSHNMN